MQLFCETKLNNWKAQNKGGQTVSMKHIQVKGAREHNLKNIDIEIPRDAQTCPRAVPHRAP